LRLDAQVLPPLYENAQQAVEQGFQVHLTGEDVCMVATGYMLHTALKVAGQFNKQNIHIGVIDLIDLYGFNKARLLIELRRYKKIVSLEEGFKGCGGMDALLFNLLNEKIDGPQLVNLGVEGAYRFDLGTRSELHELVGIGPLVVEQRVKAIIKEIQTKT
jgi:transketolase